MPDEFVNPSNYGLSFRRPPVLDILLGKLRGKGGKAYVYGGFIRDAICLGSNQRSGDIDVAMSLGDFKRLKDPDEDIRKHFVLHEPHLLFMIHQLDEDVFKDNPRPLVLRLKPEAQVAWGLTHAVGLMLFKSELDGRELLADHDLGFNGVWDDGEALQAIPGFVDDVQHKTMTMMRARDARDYERIVRRMQRFQETGYDDWQPVIPESFRLAFSAQQNENGAQ